MSAGPQDLFPIQHVGSDGHPLRVGDRVGFIARGWFLPREQESFGVIIEIDARGGVRIKSVEVYKRFSTSGRLATTEEVFYYTHHRYDAKSRTRIYNVPEGEHQLHIYRIEPEDFESRVQAAKETQAQFMAEARAAAQRRRDEANKRKQS